MSNSIYLINGISGIWNSYGCPVNRGEGLSISVEDTGADLESLVDLVGFDRTPKYIGLLKDRKEISELVVMLPMIQKQLDYTEVPVTPQPKPVVDPCAPCSEKTDYCEDKDQNAIREFIGKQQHPLFANTAEDFYFSPVAADPASSNITVTTQTTDPRYLIHFCITENAWLFTIKQDIINKILAVEDYKQLSIQSIKTILDTKQDLNHDNNIVKLMKAMVKYNFPPHLNWLLFPNKVPPYAMYVAEFTSVLGKQDLSHIWQGTMPSMAEIPEEEEITIEHYLNDEEIFGGLNIAEIEDIKLSIFKCKMRAANNYYSLLKQTYSTKAQMNPDLQSKLNRDWYQYNWPYDNFSLVELLKIDAGEVREFIQPENIATTTVLKSDGTKEYTVDNKSLNDFIESNAPYNPTPYK